MTQVKLAVPCACDRLVMQFPEYHWPVCLKNPARQSASMKNKLNDSRESITIFNQPK